MVFSPARIPHLLTSLALLMAATAYGADQKGLAPIPRFPLTHSPLAIAQPVQPRNPFSLAGRSGAILGEQDGTIELWQYPVKLLSHLKLTAQLEGYPVPIELNAQAATIMVEPDHTTLVYSHAAITVRQHMFMSRNPETGPVVLFEISSRRKAELTVEFQPDLQRQWPAANTRHPGVGFVDLNPGGAYVLSSDLPRLAAMIAMPNARPGTLAPFQERPHYYAPQFHVSFDPAKDSERYFPLIVALCDGEEKPGLRTRELLRQRIEQTAAHLPALYQETSDYYAHFFDHRLTIETPARDFDKALAWNELSIDQLKVHHGNEDAYIAGLVSSGDSDRPGFGWFFGRDSLWTLYALTSTGDLDSAKNELEFLIRRQREDGKIMHELSQAAERVDWKSLPYQFAAADSTPLFVMAMEEYLKASGDKSLIANNWNAIEKAYGFTRAHTTGGVFDNEEGTGWVEGWDDGMPHQEFYLAAIDAQSTSAYARLAELMGKHDEAVKAQATLALINKWMAGYRGKDGLFAFSREEDGSYDRTPTSFPAVAWWSGTPQLPAPEAQLSNFASTRLSADWGTRAVAVDAPNYDPISYHQGSVWPLFTGWTAMAEYRAHRPLAALALLRANIDLDWQQDPGHVTELLSGDVNEPLGRSTAHQLWSAAMVAAPMVRGLFGIESDALNHQLHMAPQLPADWNQAKLHHLPFGGDELEVQMTRQGNNLAVSVHSEKPLQICISTQELRSMMPCNEPPSLEHALQIALPELEIVQPWQSSMPGDNSGRLRILEEHYEGKTLHLQIEAPAGSEQTLALTGSATTSPQLKVDGGKISGNALHFTLPAGKGSSRATLHLSW